MTMEKIQKLNAQSTVANNSNNIKCVEGLTRVPIARSLLRVLIP